jgi:hypothetical protein
MIDDIQLNTINRFQVKILLDYMGLPFRKQPKKVGDLNQLLRLCREGEPEKFEAAWKAIIDYDWDSAGADVQDELRKYKDITHLV